MKFIITSLLFFSLAFSTGSAKAIAAFPFDLNYQVTLLPKTEQAKVVITLGQGGEMVKQLKLRFDPKRFSDMNGSGDFTTAVNSAIWKPNGSGATLSYLVTITHARDKTEFDARMTTDWAIFRGDKIVPKITARLKKGASSSASIDFRLPAGWYGLETGLQRSGENRFTFDTPRRAFDRPLGWVIAGKIGVRRDRLGLTDVVIAAPLGAQLDRMAALTLINFVWPEIETAFGKTPPKILIASAGNPMWRGGLSSPNSFFLHADRPLVSENATSPLVHELSHVITRIHGEDRSDWIAEGIAEYYSIEIPYRAGGMTDERHDKVYADLKTWSRQVKSIRTDDSSGQISGRAVLLMRDLDLEIQTKTKNQKSLDDLVQILRPMRHISTEEFIAAADKLIGSPARSLRSALLVPVQ